VGDDVIACGRVDRAIACDGQSSDDETYDPDPR
jgi:hypothetical protein